MTAVVNPGVAVERKRRNRRSIWEVDDPTWIWRDGERRCLENEGESQVSGIEYWGAG